MKTEQQIKNAISDLKKLLDKVPYEQKFSQKDVLDAKIIALTWVLEKGEI